MPISKNKTYNIDAKGQSLGRLSTNIATLLRGKKEVNYAPHLDPLITVRVSNLDKIVLTGKKAEQKIYRHYTGYQGGLKEIKYPDFIKKDKLAILLVSLIIIIGILGFILSNNLIKVPVKKQSGGSENLILSEFPNNYGECINQNNQWCFSLNFNDFNPVNCFDKQEDCEGDKLRQIALKENDLSICNNINLEDRKDICFAGFALKDKNLDLCEKIINEETKTECLYLIIINLKNKGLCEKLSSQKKEECITYFA